MPGVNLARLSKWMEGSGPHADIVISSRVRLARNLQGFSFPHLLSAREQEKVTEKVKLALSSSVLERQAGKMEILPLDDLDPLQRQILVEKHLVSPQFVDGEGYRVVALGEEEVISIMINEEDHLRLQCLLPALQLHEAWRLAEAVDDALEENLDLAFHPDYGYLTACPTNVGTGMRASVMLHLPALVLTGQAKGVLAALSKMGLAVRGLYGEGTEAQGNLFQISNQLTLGRPEEEIVKNLSLVARQLTDQELSAREVLHKEAGKQLEDRIWRAHALLSGARIISSQEALALLSDLRLGVDLKIIKGIDPRILNELLVTIQPAYLQVEAGVELTPLERDVRRAEVIRQKLKKK